LLCNFSALRESENPSAIDFEGDAVATFAKAAEMGQR
jgi:hypothetical protein